MQLTSTANGEFKINGCVIPLNCFEIADEISADNTFNRWEQEMPENDILYENNHGLINIIKAKENPYILATQILRYIYGDSKINNILPQMPEGRRVMLDLEPKLGYYPIFSPVPYHRVISDQNLGEWKYAPFILSMLLFFLLLSGCLLIRKIYKK